MNELRTFFSPIDSKLNWLAIEKEILAFWNQQQIFFKLKSQLKSSRKRFSFIDGPITANNPMGVHTARGRTLKDIFQRYWAMCGYNQRFQNGFDTQGLSERIESS